MQDYTKLDIISYQFLSCQLMRVRQLWIMLRTYQIQKVNKELVPASVVPLRRLLFFKRKHQFYNWTNITHNDPPFRGATK